MDQALNSPLRASYGMSFVSILMKNDRVIKGFYCIDHYFQTEHTDHRHDRTSDTEVIEGCWSDSSRKFPAAKSPPQRHPINP